ncbi:MAG TPA: cytochrome ubiquinol oxidase subunit I, partial [Acidimicrobiales bacterium]|nr:cytochrome ubiquinol oxidase subunit I [Acidimicrobiales bacterium]
SVWKAHRERADDSQRAPFLRAARLAGAWTLVTVVLAGIAGDLQARLMDSQQPMKMAAAEALYDTSRGASFSLLTIGNLSGKPIFQIRVPHLLSLIADLTWNGTVRGIDQTQAAEAAKYGHGSYVPVIWLTYWSFRLMVGMGILLFLVGIWAVWLTRRQRIGESVWFRRAAILGIALPFVANATGWIFTEAGRQPWIVYGLMTTAKGVSAVTASDVAGTLGAFVLIYAALGTADAWLMVRAAKRRLDGTDGGGRGLVVPGLVY